VPRRRGWLAALAAAAVLTAGAAGPARAGSAGYLNLAGLRGISGGAGPMAAGPVAAGRLKAVSYRGYTFRVPSSWPVIDGARHPRDCVRFDQHAIYLGAVSGSEFCPSWLLGTTEAMLIQPGPVRAARWSAENPVARQITVTAPGIAVTATFDADPAAIYRILASASLPVPALAAARPASPAAAGLAELAASARVRARSPLPHGTMAVPALPATVASYRGRGFDACAAPSRSYMHTWLRRSPYRAIGIYIGGADRACAQANLNPGWVRNEAAAGWHFIPLYAGPQAAFGELHAPASQGAAAARDAAAQARRLGFGPRTPVYYDMEAYRPRVRLAALRFLSAWTIGLHRLGYASGVYSSSDSGVTDLARQYSRRKYAVPDIIYDALWNGAATTRDGNLQAGQWGHHHRIHQYSGNVTQTFGGDTINVDKDYLDVRVGEPGGTSQSTSAVTLPDGSVDVFYRAHGGRLMFERYAPRSGWARPVRTRARAWSAPSVVWTGSAVDVLFKGSKGYLWLEQFRPDGRQRGLRRLSAMGVLGEGPRAVAQPGGVIDVFWRGSADRHLWHGQFSPGSGWNGPQGLGGDLASAPSPVISSAGTTAVFWKGRDGSLWHVTRDLGGRWDAPASLGMGPLGGAPQATAQPGGAVEVYWAGSGNPHLWEGFYLPRSGWHGPRDLGGRVRSVPWPVTGAGTVRVLWAGPRYRLTVIRHRSGATWSKPGWDGPLWLRMGRLDSAPFAAVGGPAGPVRVFWWGRDGRLWTASLSGRGWTGPVRLAASLG